MDLYVEGHNISNLKDIQYLMVKIQVNVWGTKFKFHIDIGQDSKSESQITDANGRYVKFQSEVDIMNYLFQAGWVHKQSQISTNPSTGMKVNKSLFVRKTFNQNSQ